MPRIEQEPTSDFIYEQRLRDDKWFGVREGGMHFRGASQVEKTLARIAARLNDLGIPYATVGGMALFLHGYPRFTEDVDILVNRDGLKEIQERLTGLGYRPLFKGSKNLRDTESGVRIEFLIAGDYPGDGKPKPISFPEPSTASVEIDGISCLNLERLIELKLASGSSPGRRKDIGDVQELMRELVLPASFADRLDPTVRGLYLELWQELQVVSLLANNES